MAVPIDLGFNLDVMVVIGSVVFLVIVPTTIFLLLQHRKYGRIMIPYVHFNIRLLIFEKRGSAHFGVTRRTRAAKVKRANANYWLLQHTGEWIPAPPLDYMIDANSAMLWMAERGNYVAILPEVTDDTLKWKGYLSERDKEATLHRLRENREMFMKQKWWEKYLPIMVTSITIIMLLMFVLIVGGSINNLTDKLGKMAEAIGAMAGACTDSGVVVPPPPPPPV